MGEEIVSRTQFKISVRGLMEFILREGDLTGGSGRLRDPDAMLAGSRLHRRLQDMAGMGYKAEVALCETIDCGPFDIVLEGRADGIITDDRGHVTIDEIKGIFRPVAALEAPYPVHLAQAKCYGWIFGRQKGLSALTIQMTYGDLDEFVKGTGRPHPRYFRQDYTVEELDEWFAPILEEYKKWMTWQWDWLQTRQKSIQGLGFPFPYREGQRQLVEGIYRTIVHGRQLFVQAPTGVGKTLSALYPSVMAMGTGRCDRIFYLTAKTVTRTVAAQAVRQLEEKGLRCKAVVLTAKEKMCPLAGGEDGKMECDPGHCPRARGHFDRVNDAVFDLLGRDVMYTADVIAGQAERYQVCPHEMTLDMAGWCDMVVGDYNYVFDPRIRLKRFFGETARKEKYIFLVDEAHNLVERGRSMFSASLCKEDILSARKLAKNVLALMEEDQGSLFRPDPAIGAQVKKLVQHLGKANTRLQQWKWDTRSIRVLQRQELDDLETLLLRICGELEELLGDDNWQQGRAELLEFYFQVYHFLNMAELLDDHYLIYCNFTEDEKFYVNLFCVDPSKNLGEVTAMGASTVFFSATLLPVQYYRRLLSVREDDYTMYAPSPFDAGRRGLFVAEDVTSRYTARSADMYKKYAAYIGQVTGARQGNYMAFFPSYQFMEKVLEQAREMEWYAGAEVLVQLPSMGERQRHAFLEQFREDAEGTVVGFCILGGIFSEGIDLTADRLIGAVIVGTGLPQIDSRGEMLRQYFREQGENGFDYAYRYPGMNKVLQAAGRVIRTVEDKGVVALLDSRFLEAENYTLFPREWSGRQYCTLQTVGEQVRAFWQGLSETDLSPGE